MKHPHRRGGEFQRTKKVKKKKKKKKGLLLGERSSTE
jgi:hypothetical protein